jgi:hypothetical protein
MSRLNQLTIAKPCPASWDEMAGDDRVRHCELCKLNVYNVASLTTTEALELVEKAEGRLCVRLYMRADGTVLTADCPVGVHAAWRRVASVVSVALSLVLTVASVLYAKLEFEPSDAPTPLAEAWRASKECLVKVLPAWMVPAGWISKPEPAPEFVWGAVAISRDPPLKPKPSLEVLLSPDSKTSRSSRALSPRPAPVKSK